MSKFNATMPKAKTLTENLAGGQAYSQSNELALVSLLLTSFVNDQFYRNAQTTLDELRGLVTKVKDKSLLSFRKNYLYKCLLISSINCSNSS